MPIELGIAISDKSLIKELLAPFPDADVRFESGFGYLAVAATVIVPTATLAVKLAELFFELRREKRSEDELVCIRYKRTKDYVEIVAKGKAEGEVLASIKAISNAAKV
ncbi:MAG TPA: hypothetical protein VJW20_16015 [Candidatus Angelobacter sp.]|nr:hypothetical protein [Candidatus Angelobacter sp.]